MQITRATDYAVRVMVQLASAPEDHKMQLEDLAELTGVRANFLSKILQRLVHQGLVSSHRGTGGGFCLKAPPANISLLQVIEAMEGPIEINVCLEETPHCERQSWCGIHPYWRDAQSAMKVVLNGVSIAQIAEQTTANLASRSELQQVKE